MEVLMNLTEKLQAAAAKICQRQNLHLVEVKVRGSVRQPLLEVFADSEQGITLRQCATLSRLIQDELDMDETFTSNYRLNVSSPGLDRPLTEDWEFKKNLGKKVVVAFTENGEARTTEGELKSFDAQELVVEQKHINRSDVTKVKVKIQW